MKVKKVPLEQAIGHILLHNQVGQDGRKALKKGQLLTQQDLPTLQALGRSEVYVAILADGDIPENEAAHRLGEIIAQSGIRPTTATTGRVNLISNLSGLFKAKSEALLAFNDRRGITLATIPGNTVVSPKKIVGTIKIIPYAVPVEALRAAETIARQEGPLVEVKPFVLKKAALITTGSPAARTKVIDSFTPALRDRLLDYKTELVEGPYVAEDEAEIGEALQWALANGAQMILVAGETSIMDVDDITPRAIKAVGGEIVHYGVPVEPGNLLLLAYRNEVPIVGAPGCAKSKNFNVVDMILPRLAAGERLDRKELVKLGPGGLLK